jgi:site-specific DNA-methyltransferase (adenine-specific)
MSNRIIHGSSTSANIISNIPKAKMVFADPPDNLGLKYDGYKDKIENYEQFLQDVILGGVNIGEIFWLSYYHKYQGFVLSLAEKYFKGRWRQFIWRFTFGQHRQSDFGNGYRPILRIMDPSAVTYPDEIRVESARQKVGDKRADIRGRVPDDVWDFSRVCGNFKERRPWHPTQHPEALMERIIKFSTKSGDLVTDMFGGTFTTARVCEKLGRDCISIEISEEYCEKGRADLDELRSESI